MTAANQESGIHSVEQLGENIVQLLDMRAAAGKSGPFDICIGARQRLKFGDGDSAAAYVDAIGEMTQVGVTWTMVEPRHGSRQEYLENVQWFGEEVIAKLRG